MDPILLGIGIISVFATLFIVVQYNGLVTLKNHIKEAWSNVDTELQRRYDLIPNLVESVKGYAKHEQETLQRVIEMRTRCVNNHGSVSAQSIDEALLVGELKHLLAVVENYPELKADRHFARLQTELIHTEDRIQAARRFFNGNVRDYRNKCEAFPSNLIAGLFGFKTEDYFDVDPSIREAPTTPF